jgi:PAS domain-containing protein
MRISEIQHLCDLLPEPVLLVDGNGRITYGNAASVEAFDWRKVAGRPAAEVVVTEPPLALARILETGKRQGEASHAPLRVRNAWGLWLDRFAIVVPMSKWEEGARMCVLSRAPYPLDLMLALLRENKIMRSLVMGSQEAFWCIEFDEPVDVTADPEEIIRQVFENQCHWTMCNAAMGRIYDLPDNIDLNDLPVRTFFHRSNDNETFIRGIIEAGYSIDSMPSCDIRHDGTPIFVENSVRCHIDNGVLYRMMGTLRDLTPFKRTEFHLTKLEGEIREILGSIPDAVVVFNSGHRLHAANHAFGNVFGLRVEDWLGCDIRPVVDFSSCVTRYRCDGENRFMIDGHVPGGSAVRCEATLSLMSGDAAERFVAVLRPVKL